MKTTTTEVAPDIYRIATFIPEAQMQFNQFLMAPYFGPGLLPHAQKLWIDELAAGTKRIGPLPSGKSPAALPSLRKITL